MSAFGDRRLAARAAVALTTANVRFWSTVAPLLGAQIERWRERALQIGDPSLRALALEKLSEERFNAEVAATLAVLAPRAHRTTVVEAIVAYQVIYDYLDGLTEQPAADPLRSGRGLYRAFTDAITPGSEAEDSYHAHQPIGGDGGYLKALVMVVQRALARLPSTATINQSAGHAAARCAEAQVRAHAVPVLGTTQVEQWATRQASDTALGWRQFLAGAASSVLAVHALIAAAADAQTTPEEAVEIDMIYLSIGVVSTMLDSLIDHQQDTRAGQTGYIHYYEDHELLSQDLAAAARHAIQRATPLRNGPHHLMTLAGVAAYYLSAPTANSEFAAPVTERIRTELRPLITPTLAVMRIWRTAKCARAAITSRAAKR